VLSGLLVADVADARELVLDGLAVHVLRGVGVLEGEGAGEDARAHHDGHEARALLVGPEATSMGASVSMLWSFSVRTTSRPASTP
jgi:hypothetical protein